MTDTTRRTARRDFLIKSVAGAAAVPLASQAKPQLAGDASTGAQGPQAEALPSGYVWLRPAEQAFVEALVNHMCPADDLTPDGVALGLNVYFDRALGGNWGQGDRLYLQGPFRPGSPNQGYQLGMTPAALFRTGTEGLAQYTRAAFGKDFDALPAVTKEQVLKDLQSGKIALPNGVPGKTYFAQLLQMFYEAMFADPVYGGNRDKMAWKMIGYPGVNTTNRLNIVKFRNRPYRPDPLGIADVS